MNFSEFSVKYGFVSTPVTGALITAQAFCAKIGENSLYKNPSDLSVYITRCSIIIVQKQLIFINTIQLFS